MDFVSGTKEVITPESIRAAIREVFPGANVELIGFTGGTVIHTRIWQFTMDITLTTNPIVYSEKAGEVRMVLQWKSPDGKPVTINSFAGRVLEQHGAIRAFVISTRAYLDGIIAAITMAEEDPPPEPEANLV